MTGKMVSLRLDDEAARALALLTAGGKSRSDAIRDALLETARRTRSEALRAEAEAAARDRADLAEARATLEFMESLDESW
ncbi:MAG TPA: ribbon-helix-helix protein, CopG family [Gaiellaceae bacterium]|nr:ribbon-helix-helix protein, CopG family [Gaiellaceae bacterium]